MEKRREWERMSSNLDLSALALDIDGLTERIEEVIGTLTSGSTMPEVVRRLREVVECLSQSTVHLHHLVYALDALVKNLGPEHQEWCWKQVSTMFPRLVMPLFLRYDKETDWPKPNENLAERLRAFPAVIRENPWNMYRDGELQMFSDFADYVETDVAPELGDELLGRFAQDLRTLVGTIRLARPDA